MLTQRIDLVSNLEPNRLPRRELLLLKESYRKECQEIEMQNSESVPGKTIRKKASIMFLTRALTHDGTLRIFPFSYQAVVQKQQLNTLTTPFRKR
jgi:hypothetical protein